MSGSMITIMGTIYVLLPIGPLTNMFTCNEVLLKLQILCCYAIYLCRGEGGEQG